MDITIKIKSFEYWLTQILQWGNELTPQVPVSSFTRLKALKLLFFTSAIKDSEGNDLLDVFDNFYALPNGPVESDIYNCITADLLTYYTFKDFSVGKKQEFEDNKLNEDLKKRIDNAIVTLRKKNERIVSFNAEQLVALSHSWPSWQNAIMIAKVLGKGSYKMDVRQIKNNPQFFGI